MKTAFETEVCSRCNGTGRHSFNGEHSICYKCDGKNDGKALTKRGAAAKAYYLAKFQVAASTVVVGDLISIDATKLRVKSIEVKPQTMKINGKPVEGNAITFFAETHSIQVGECSTVRRFPSTEENEAAIADALAYQATLTKAGTVRAR